MTGLPPTPPGNQNPATGTPSYLHIPYDELKSTLEEILLTNNFPPNAAATCAEVFATNSLEGVYSHGVNRFAKFIDYVRARHVKADAHATCKHQARALEQWDGQSGPGPVNAYIAVDRAMELARAYGMGCVALANTNHWLRGGTYAWKAAHAGFAYIAWSNTISNMPPWGAVEKKLGNNPIIMAVPALRSLSAGGPARRSFSEGEPALRSPSAEGPNEDEALVLDMALSQYSFGALEIKRQNNQQLPLPGGYDKAGNLTTDPAAIMESWRPLPIGYWKGSGLSLLLDVFAALLSGGLSTAEISKQQHEKNLSQVFICVDLSQLHNYTSIGQTLHNIITDYASATPVNTRESIRYPGQHIPEIRNQNLAHGIPVLKRTWNMVLGLK